MLPADTRRMTNCPHCAVITAQLDQARRELEQYRVLCGQSVKFVLEFEAQVEILLAGAIMARKAIASYRVPDQE